MRKTLFSFFLYLYFFEVCLLGLANAQNQSIQTDGSTNTTFGPSCGTNCDRIEGGLRVGENLFHSFQEFNVIPESTVEFSDPGVENILSRVVGTNISLIEGGISIVTVQGTNASNANFYLINPNGIIFRSGSIRLTSGSVFLTSADAVMLSNGEIFSANVNDPLPSQLLNVQPSAFLFNQIVSSNNVNNDFGNLRFLESSFLEAGSFGNRQNVFVLGRDVIVDTSTIRARGGRVEIGGITGNGRVGIEESIDSSTNTRLSFSQDARGNVVLENASIRAVDGDVVINSGDFLARKGTINAAPLTSGGVISILAQQGIRFEDGSLLEASGFGFVNTFRGINLMADQGDISLEESTISMSTLTNSDGANITIRARALELEEGSSLAANTSSTGSAGNVLIQVNENFILNDRSFILTVTGSSGAGGDILIDAKNLSLRGASFLSAQSVENLRNPQSQTPDSAGVSGNVVLENIERLQVVEGSRISASTEVSQAGSVLLNQNMSPAEFVLVSGEGSQIASEATDERGRSGSVSLNARSIVVEDGAVISASTVSGVGGNVSLHGLHTLMVDSAQVSASTVTGMAGNLVVNSPEDPARSVVVRGLLLNDQGQLLADSNGQPIRASLAVRATGEGGQAGDLRINTALLRVEDGAEVSVESLAGQAGVLSILAESIILDRGLLNAETALDSSGSAQSANISLSNFALLLLQNQSSISASASAQATGGNISFDSPEGFIIALPFTNSDIIAQADQGRGGVISFDIAGIYGLEQRDAVPGNNTNDISVNSTSGQAGTITINDLAADPSRSRTELLETVLDARNLIDRSCSADVGQGRNSFVVTGRGGLPPAPADIVRSDNAGLEDFGAETDTTVTNPVEPAPEPSARREPELPTQIVEAQTWYRNASGTAVLTASRPDRTGDFSVPVQTFCDRS
ncbi:hypothetical protein C8255_03730 [filamentous cyanobacterium CCP3]|nr:hypothetical protein C8255_03730 [filamentous cyanobacterium CCP3]